MSRSRLAAKSEKEGKACCGCCVLSGVKAAQFQRSQGMLFCGCGCDSSVVEAVVVVDGLVVADWGPGVGSESLSSSMGA